MTEAADALVRAWFEWTPATRLDDASARVTNAASRRVLEMTGFVWTRRAMRLFPLRGGEHEVDRFRLDRGPGSPGRPVNPLPCGGGMR